MKRIIIFTDLDGTLLDYSHYSYAAAQPALQLVKEKNIPLVICSSKTRKEIEHYRNKLHNLHPFISENGGGIYIPKGYFKSGVESLAFQVEEEGAYTVLRLGARYSDLRKAIEELRAEGFNIKGFGDMTVDEVASLTKLTKEEAEMAKQRDFDEPFVFTGAIHDLPLLSDAIRSKALHYTQGQFHHILGNSDKGKAVSVLIDLYRREIGAIAAIAIGDSQNDVSMLERVDYPVIVQKPDGSYDPRINLPNVERVDGIGPDGWNKAVINLVIRLLQ